MNLLRIFIPSWRFFDELGQIATVSHRSRLADQSDFGPWQTSILKPTQSPAAFLFNPAGNIYLASQALVQQLMVDILNLKNETDTGSLEQLCSFQLLQKHIELQLRKNNSLLPPLFFQIKISVEDPNQPQNNYDAVVSKEYAL